VVEIDVSQSIEITDPGQPGNCGFGGVSVEDPYNLALQVIEYWFATHGLVSEGLAADNGVELFDMDMAELDGLLGAPYDLTHVGAVTQFSDYYGLLEEGYQTGSYVAIDPDYNDNPGATLAGNYIFGVIYLMQLGD
jgi:hypothetical protein